MADIQVEEKTIQILKEPGKFAVVYLNDEKTPMDFVIQSLIKHFQYNKEQANKMTNTIHNEGKGVCGVYPRDVAETKLMQAINQARAQEFPLQLKLEEPND